MKVIAVFDLPEGSRPLSDAELAYMDNQNRYQWKRTRTIRKIPSRILKIKRLRGNR